MMTNSDAWLRKALVMHYLSADQHRQLAGKQRKAGFQKPDAFFEESTNFWNEQNSRYE
jgi:type II secretory pathway component PulK